MKQLIAIFFYFVSSLSFAAQMTESDFTRYFMKHATETLTDVQFRIVQPLQITRVRQLNA
jgi:hypothetical protein